MLFRAIKISSSNNACEKIYKIQIKTKLYFCDTFMNQFQIRFIFREPGSILQTLSIRLHLRTQWIDSLYRSCLHKKRFKFQ